MIWLEVEDEVVTVAEERTVAVVDVTMPVVVVMVVKAGLDAVVPV